MPAYSIVLMKTKNPDPTPYMKNYVIPFLSSKGFSAAGGKLLAADENPTVFEGDWPYNRTVLLEFPSKEKMLEWYHSEEYQAIVGHRHEAAECRGVLVESFDLERAGEMLKQFQ